MPLSRCSPLPPPPAAPQRVSWNGSIVTAWGKDGERVWQRDLGRPVIRAELTDLDADDEQEIVAGAATGIVAWSERGDRKWSSEEGIQLRTFVIAEEFRKRTRQVVALWSDQHSSTSRLSIIGSDGRRVAGYEHRGFLRNLAVDRPTGRHAPKIIVTSGSTLFVLDPKKVSTGAPLWSGSIHPSTATIARLEIVDHDDDGKRDISIATMHGSLFILDFEGKVISRNAPADVRFAVAPRNTRRSAVR